MTKDPRTDEEFRAAALASEAWMADLRKSTSERYTGSWRELPPTEKQVRCIQDAGRVLPTTRGEASDLIGVIIREKQDVRDRNARRWRWFDAAR